MQKMPEFIKATYDGEHKDDYALKAKIAMDGLADHPEEREYILAYAANFLRFAGKLEESIAQCRQILPTLTIWDCKSDTFRTLIYALEAMGQMEEAVEVRLQLMQEDTSKYNDHDDIAKAYKTMGNIEKSIEHYLLYIKENKGESDLDTYNELAGLYEITGDFDNSAKYLLKAARILCEESAYLWFNTGRVLMMAGKEDEAKFYFEVSLKLDPKDESTYFMLGNIYQNKKDHYRALHYYFEGLKIQPQNAAAYNNIGSLSFEDGDIKAAIEYMEKALTMNPDTKIATTLYINLARLHHKISDYDKHEYYQGKMLQEVGFPVDFNPEDDGDDEDEDDLLS